MAALIGIVHHYGSAVSDAGHNMTTPSV